MRHVGRHKENLGAEKALGRHEACGAPLGKCVAIKADGVPLRQIWAPRRHWGAVRQRKIDYRREAKKNGYRREAKKKLIVAVRRRKIDYCHEAKKNRLSP